MPFLCYNSIPLIVIHNFYRKYPCNEKIIQFLKLLEKYLIFMLLLSTIFKIAETRLNCMTNNFSMITSLLLNSIETEMIVRMHARTE